MKVSRLEFIPVSVPYTHREVSSQVNRDGVTDILVKATTDDGLVGWGEACSGANVESVQEALRAMTPFVLGRSPWESEAIRRDLWQHGLWQFRKGTGNFAFAGLDMALADLCGKATGAPLHQLLGGQVRDSVNYFYYLSRGTPDEMTRQTRDAIARGFHVLYFKVGLDIAAEIEMARAIRAAAPAAKIRVDANGAWSVADAVRHIAALDEVGLDFVEQPVRPDPLAAMQEVRARVRPALSANEGLWSAEDAYRQITARTADVYCFSPYWVGSLAQFLRLSHVAGFEGFAVCKHTHGELGIAAAAAHHALLTLPNIVEGNQQTAHVMAGDVLTTPLPIATQPQWSAPTQPGLGVTVDEAKVAEYHETYRRDGQFLPYDPKFTWRNA